VEFTLTRIGDGGAAKVICGSGEFISDPTARQVGPDSERLFSCSGELTTKPAVPLNVIGSGTTTLGTVVAGPGKLSVTGSTPRKGRLTAAAARKRKRAPFKTLEVTAKQGGPVQLPLKLTSPAKKQLKKRHKLTVGLKVSFKPAGAAKAIVHTQKFTFTTAPTPIKPHRRK
jgi:hypothetical protein